jgi:probable addiction module antidote protein
MPLETKPFDAAEYLDSPEMIEAYLADAMADPDPGELVAALAVIARAKGMTEVAREAGLARPALYRSLRKDSRPEWSTIVKVLAALGFQLKPVAVA